MDNASKALVMAGAILIAVMLVSIGVLIYNSAVGTVETGLDQMSGTEVELFNNSYNSFFGNNKKPSVAKSLIEKVNTFNRTSSDRSITLTGNRISRGWFCNKWL